MALPNLCLYGAGKSGSTSLFNYLGVHPDVYAPPRKEARYFEPLRNPDAVLAPLSEFQDFFSGSGSQRYRLDASPHTYLAGDRAIEAVKETLGDPKMFFIIREPVGRMQSQWRFMQTRQLRDGSLNLDGFAVEAMRPHDSPGAFRNMIYWTFYGSLYGELLPPWLDAFPDAKVYFYDDLRRDPEGLMRGLLGWLEIDQDVDLGAYDVHNKTVHYKNRLLHRAALRVNNRLEPINRALPGIKRFARETYYRFNGRPALEPGALTNADALAMIAESNRKLGEDLTRRGYTGLPSWLADGQPSQPSQPSV